MMTTDENTIAMKWGTLLFEESNGEPIRMSLAATNAAIRLWRMAEENGQIKMLNDFEAYHKERLTLLMLPNNNARWNEMVAKGYEKWIVTKHKELSK